jgi:hypothetical protein
LANNRVTYFNPASTYCLIDFLASSHSIYIDAGGFCKWLIYIPSGGTEGAPGNTLSVRRMGNRAFNIDYHIEVERHSYSVPYALVHQGLDIRLMGETVEIFTAGSGSLPMAGLQT